MHIMYLKLVTLLNKLYTWWKALGGKRHFAVSYQYPCVFLFSVRGDVVYLQCILTSGRIALTLINLDCTTKFDWVEKAIIPRIADTLSVRRDFLAERNSILSRGRPGDRTLNSAVNGPRTRLLVTSTGYFLQQKCWYIFLNFFISLVCRWIRYKGTLYRRFLWNWAVVCISLVREELIKTALNWPFGGKNSHWNLIG